MVYRPGDAGEMFSFEKLKVWQIAVDFAEIIYAATKNFPEDERFGLRSQLRRSSVSIAANVAEGSGRSSSKDFVRFIEIAFGSLMETVSHLEIARRQNLIPVDKHRLLYEQSERLGKMLSGLRRSLNRPN